MRGGTVGEKVKGSHVAASAGSLTTAAPTASSVVGASAAKIMSATVGTAGAEGIVITAPAPVAEIAAI
jgi:hypothetical protein